MKGTTKQVEALKYLTDNKHNTILYGGAAGGGKTFLGCFWLLIMAKSYPNTRWFIGREELKRIRQSTLITWYKVCKELKFEDYYVNFQDNFIQLNNGSRIDLLDLRYIPSDVMYERFGSIEYTGGWIEEGGEINFGAYDTLQTRVGRHYNKEYGLLPKILITCNPKKNWLYTYFYKPFKNGILSKDCVFIQALITDNPNLDPSYVENLHKTKDKAKRERLLYGNWEYDDDPAQLIDFEAANDYFDNSQVIGIGKKYITADIARKGRDKTVVRVWHGWRAVYRTELIVNTIPEAAKLINDLAIQYQIPMSRVIVDEDGVGGGVKDLLDCEGFVNNSRALNNENFANLKTQCSFSMATMIMERLVAEDCENEDIKQRVIEEMEQVRQAEMDNDTKVQIIAKDKIKDNIGRSPDEWDSIMMRFYFELVASDFYFG